LKAITRLSRLGGPGPAARVVEVVDRRDDQRCDREREVRSVRHDGNANAAVRPTQWRGRRIAEPSDDGSGRDQDEHDERERQVVFVGRATAASRCDTERMNGSAEFEANPVAPSRSRSCAAGR
jgi:hypothetical protein